MNVLRLTWAVLRSDRRTRTSTILIAVGVAVASALVLLLAGLPQATQARADRAAWQHPTLTVSEPANPDMLQASSAGHVDGAELTKVDVAATGSGDITLPTGVEEFPGPGEMLVSPALRKQLIRLPDAALADRFDAQVTGILGEQALSAPEQLVALVGHEPGGMPQQAVAMNGFELDPGRVDPMLTLLAGVGMVVLLVPSLVLVASAARLIAARRERRLAALRLAGATPRQVVGTVAAETAVAAIVGAAVGVATNPLLRRLVSLVPWKVGTWQPDDFTLGGIAAWAIAFGLVVLVVLSAVLGLRRVVSTPLGAAAQHTPQPLRWWRLLALPVAGSIFLAAVMQAREGGGSESLYTVLFGLVLLIGSFALVGPWVTAAVGSLFVRLWRRPAALLAGRRLRGDPQGAYRASAGVVLAVFTGSMALTLLPSLNSMGSNSDTFESSVLYVDSGAERAGDIVERANTVLEQYEQDQRAIAIPRVILHDGAEIRTAMVMDCRKVDRVTRLEVGSCDGDPAVYASGNPSATGLTVSGGARLDDGVALESDIPVRPLRTEGAYTDAVITPDALPPDLTPASVTVAVPTAGGDAAAIHTALVRAAPGNSVKSPAFRVAEQQDLLADIQRVTVIGLVIAAVLAGGSAAITTAGGVMDRRRTFGALIAAGTPVRVLARALRTEAALPAFITTIGAGAVGTFAGIGLFLTASPHGNPVLSPWILVPIALGVLVAALGGVICRPVLNQIAAEPLSDE